MEKTCKCCDRAEWMDEYCHACWEEYAADAYWEMLDTKRSPAPKRPTLQQLPERVVFALMLWDWQPWRWAKIGDRYCFDLPDAWHHAGVVQETIRGERG